jgi:hypothetical protein
MPRGQKREPAKKGQKSRYLSKFKAYQWFADAKKGAYYARSAMSRGLFGRPYVYRVRSPFRLVLAV